MTPGTAAPMPALQRQPAWFSAVLRDGSRIAPLRVLVVTVLVYLMAVIGLLFWVVPSGMLQAVARSARGLISGTLLGNVFLLSAAGCVLWAWGRSRLRELGVLPPKLFLAARVTLVLWVLLNVGAAAWQLWSGSALELATRWRRPGPTWMIGSLLGQLLGNALCEEVLFRDVLLRQTFWHLSRGAPRAGALLLAAVLSQALFASVHGLAFLSEGVALPAALASLPKIMAAGCACAALYLATGSLLVVVGVHALANTPTLLVNDPFGYDNLGLLIALCIAAFLVVRVFQRAALAQPPSGSAAQ